VAYVITGIVCMVLGGWTVWSYAKFLLGEQQGKHSDEMGAIELKLSYAEAQNKGLSNTLKVRSATDEELEKMLDGDNILNIVPKPSIH